MVINQRGQNDFTQNVEKASKRGIAKQFFIERIFHFVLLNSIVRCQYITRKKFMFYKLISNSILLSVKFR